MLVLWLLRFGDFVQLALIIASTFLNLDGLGQALQTHELVGISNLEQNSTKLHINVMMKYDVPNAPMLQSDTANNAGGLCFNMEDSRYDNPESINFSCPFRNSIGFLAINLVFAVYFVVLLVVRGWAVFKFAHDDWRSQLFVDQFNSRRTAFWLSFCGSFIVGGMTAYGLYFAISQHGATKVTVSVWMPLVLWFVTTVIGLNFDSHFCINSKAEVFEEEFPNPIPITEVPGGNDFLNILTMVWNRQNITDGLSTALVMSLAKKNAAATNIGGGAGLLLDALTDKPDELMRLLVRLKEEDEAPEAPELSGGAGGGGTSTQSASNSSADNDKAEEKKTDSEQKYKQVSVLSAAQD